MFVRYVGKIFALKPRADTIEAGIITALVLTALLSSILAVRDPLTSIYDRLASVGIASQD